MSDRETAFRGARAGREGSCLLHCERCDDVVLSIEGTTKRCCGAEMSPPREPASVPSGVRLEDPEQMLRSVFGIGRTAVEVCLRVLEAGEATAGEISEQTDLDKSGVARHLNHLDELGLIDKSVENLREGGSVHVYRAPSTRTVKRRPQTLFLCWATDALDVLDAMNEQKVDLVTGRASYSPERIYWPE